MQKTIIGWTDVSWNPTSGCSKVSDGCRFCYAETLAQRWSNAPPWTVSNEAQNVTVKAHKLKEPYALKSPSRVFVNSMSDLFHRAIPDWYRAVVFAVMLDLPQHKFQVLTKRAEALADWPHRFSVAVQSADYLSLLNASSTDRRIRRAMDAASHASTPWSENIWQGVSIEDRRALTRLDALKACGARVKFISAEPLLQSWGDVDLAGIDQVLVGGESGAHMPQHRDRWMHAEWAREIRDLCIRDGAAFFYKQASALRTEVDPQLLHEDGQRWKWQQYPGERHAPEIQFVRPRIYALSGDWCALPYEPRGIASDNTDDCESFNPDMNFRLDRAVANANERPEIEPIQMALFA